MNVPKKLDNYNVKAVLIAYWVTTLYQFTYMLPKRTSLQTDRTSTLPSIKLVQPRFLNSTLKNMCEEIDFGCRRCARRQEQKCWIHLTDYQGKYPSFYIDSRFLQNSAWAVPLRQETQSFVCTMRETGNKTLAPHHSETRILIFWERSRNCKKSDD